MTPVTRGKIRLYCVGVYFYQEVDFHDDGGGFMRGSSILAAAAARGLRYQVNTVGHIEYLSYTPKLGDPLSHPPAPPLAFPFYGLPLSLREAPAPIGEVSHIFQYTCDATLATSPAYNPQFVNNGFPTDSEIRIRLVSIYVNQAPTY